MRNRPLVLMLGLLLAAACSLVAPTGDTKTDPEAAQNFLPNIVGFTTTDADNITDALAGITGGASLLSGNPALAAIVAKLDDMVQCYQEVGAVTARIYTQTSIDITNPQIPGLGAVAIINQDRLRDNFLACALSAGFSAQAAAIEPCFGSGDFKVNDDTLSYLYGATMPQLCAAFEQHFTALRASGQ